MIWSHELKGITGEQEREIEMDVHPLVVEIEEFQRALAGQSRIATG